MMQPIGFPSTVSGSAASSSPPVTVIAYHAAFPEAPGNHAPVQLDTSGLHSEGLPNQSAIGTVRLFLAGIQPLAIGSEYGKTYTVQTVVLLKDMFDLVANMNPG